MGFLLSKDMACGDDYSKLCYWLVSNPELSSQVANGLSIFLVLSVSVLDVNSDHQALAVPFSLSTIGTQLHLTVQLPPSIQSGTFFLHAITTKDTTYTSTDPHSLILSSMDLNTTEVIPMSQIEVVQTETLGLTMASITSLNPTSSSSLGAVISLLMSMEPTGLLARMMNVLKITSRLVYLDLQYGYKLYLFMLNAETLSGVLKTDRDTEMR